MNDFNYHARAAGALVDVNPAILVLRERVLVSLPLLDRLRAISATRAFVVEVLHVAAELNLEITAADVEQALRTARRECIESWS